MAIIKSVHTAFNFLVSEANDWRSRDQREVAAPAGEDDLPVATIMAAGATADAPLVPWTGTGNAFGILCQAVPAGETERRTIITRDAEVVGADLELPGSTTLAAATAALRPLGIIVRVNEGQFLDVVAPATT